MSTLKTVASMSLAQLNGLLDSLPKAARINRGDGIVTVYAPNDKKVISAASANGLTWHVMAVEGLIETA